MSSAIHAKKARNKLINKMKKETEFHEQFECENLAIKYEELCGDGPGIQRAAFRDFLVQTFGITDDLLLDRVFRAFDMDSDNIISPEEWFQGMSTFLRGSHSKQAKFCFHVYDLNSDGFITREEMFSLLKKSIQAGKVMSDEDPDEGIRELVELALKKLKRSDSTDQKITPEEFETAVQEDPLMMQCLGTCLPTQKVIMEFEDTVCWAGQPDYSRNKAKMHRKC